MHQCGRSWCTRETALGTVLGGPSREMKGALTGQLDSRHWSSWPCDLGLIT